MSANRPKIIVVGAGFAYLLGKIPLGGFFAWLLWLRIHLYYLPGISNRFKVLGAWLKDYLLRDRSVKQVFTGRYLATEESLLIDLE